MWPVLSTATGAMFPSFLKTDAMFVSILKGCGILIVASAIWILRSEVRRINTWTDEVALESGQMGVTASFGNVLDTTMAEDECSACGGISHCTVCYGEGTLDSHDGVVDCIECGGTGECPVCRGHTADIEQTAEIP
jgi:hypothetical protein